MNWTIHLGGLGDASTARISKRESSREACLLTAVRRADAGEVVVIVGPDGAAEKMDKAGAGAALDVARIGA